MKRVYLISCVKSKQKDLPSCRAEKMYISPLYRASLSYALSFAENKTEQIFILSALYGLLSLDDSISYYEKTLGAMSATEKAAWGRKVSEKLAGRFDFENTHFVFLAGEKYVAPLRKYLRHYSEPMHGMASIGGRISWLRANAGNHEKIFTQPSTPAAKPSPVPRRAVNKNAFADTLCQQMESARENGETSLTVTSGELHRLVGGYPGPNHKMTVCCSAMYAAMREGDLIVASPPSGKGASLKITYALQKATTATVPQNTAAVFIAARELRSAEALHRVSKDKPGWYRWWAPEDVVVTLLNSPHVSQNYMEVLAPHLWRRKSQSGDDYYCLYVGVAIKESIRDRLNWHINQRHTENAVRSGTLSTLRRTLSSLATGNQYDESATNAVIDRMMVEYYAMDYPIKSEVAKTEIANIEQGEMERRILPLNIMGNRHAILEAFLADLKRARKASNPYK